MRHRRVAGSEESWWAREWIWALTAVIVVHVVIAWALSRPLSLPADQYDTLEVMFLIQPPTRPAGKTKAPIQSRIRSLRTRQASAQNAGKSRQDEVVEVQRVASQAATVQTPVLTVQGDDSWDQTANKSGDGLTYQYDPLHAAPNPLGPTRAGQFHMRKQLSPRDVVRGLSQLLGFWPPGYTDNPCGGIRRSVEMLSMATDDASRLQLVDALQAEERYCQ